MSDIRYKWNDGLNSVQVSGDVSLPQFKVIHCSSYGMPKVFEDLYRTLGQMPNLIILRQNIV